MSESLKELFDQHQKLFGAQMRNWDDHYKQVRRINFWSGLVGIVVYMAMVASIFFRAPLLVLFAGFLTWFALIPAISNTSCWIISRKYRRIDRELEQRKADIEAKIEALPPKPAPMSLSVSFTGRRKYGRRKKRLAYSPWSDYRYSMYWR